MNDWTNDDLQVGDLVIVHATANGYMRGLLENSVGIVVSLSVPPLGSHHTYDVQVMTDSKLIHTVRQHLEKIYD